jgi:phosphomevalonate kinase
MPGAVSVSAPGKVLLAGGYLVLERPNVGVVLSTTARFFCTAQWATVQEKPEGWASDKVMIVVESPQFRATYRYLCTLHSPNHAAPALLSL